MELTNDIVITTSFPEDLADIIDNIDTVWDLADTIYYKNILIGDKIYFGEPHERVVGEETEETYDSFFGYDATRSALTFNGNFYVTGGVVALQPYNLGSGASLTIYNGLDSTAITISLSAAQGKALNDRVKYLEDNPVTSLTWSAITGKPTWVDSSTKPTYSVGEISGAVPNTLKINGSALTQNLTIESVTSGITDGTHTLTTQGGTIGGNLRLRHSTDNYGSKLNFGDGDYCYLYENSDDHLKIYADKGATLQYVDRIYFTGSTTTNYFEYDAANGALKYEGSLYVTGGLSSLGFSSNGNSGTVAKLIIQSGLTVNSATTINGNLSVKDNLIFSHGASIYNDSSGRLHFGGGYGDEPQQSIAYADNQALYVNYLLTTSTNIGYQTNSSEYVYIPSQFNVIKNAFNNYSTLSDIKSYIINNLK